jgi:hypothetical protein
MNFVNRKSIFVLLLLALATFGCKSVERDFDKAAKANTEQAYRDFLKTHRDHPLAEEAKTVVAQII